MIHYTPRAIFFKNIDHPDVFGYNYIMKKLIFILFLCLYAHTAQGSPLSTEQYVQIDGRKIYVAVEADDDKAPVLLVLPYGPGGNCEYVRKGLGRELRRRFTVVYTDPYGGGRSPLNGKRLIYDRNPVQGLHASMLADDIGKIMDVLGYETFGIMAHDFGAYTALLYASSHTERIDFFIAVNPRFDYRNSIRRTMSEMSDFFMRRSAAAGESASAALDENKSNVLTDIWMKNTLTGRDMERYHELFKEADGGFPYLKSGTAPDGEAKTFKALFKEPLFTEPYDEYGYLAFVYSDDFYDRDIISALSAIGGIPAVMVFSGSGPFSPGLQEDRITCFLPDAVVMTFSASGFYPMLEESGRFIAMLDSLLASVDL